MADIFGKTVTILEKNLDLRAMRHNVIASNIANQETPGYKAKDLSFKKELDRAGSLSLVNVSMTRTHPSHLNSANTSSSISGTEVTARTTADSNLDGNNVNVEEEMAIIAENSIMYDATVQILTKKFSGISNAIREGK